MADALEDIGKELFPEAQAPELQPEPAPEPAPEPTPEIAPEAQPPAPQPEAKAEEHHVPLAKYLDTREERNELRRRIAEMEAAKAPPQQAPEPFDDQEKGFVSAEIAKVRFEMSDAMARQTHGPEKVEEAAQWAMQKAQSDPIFAAQYMREPHPIDWIVRQHQRDGLLQQIGEDPDDYVRRRAAELGLTAAPAGTPPPAAPASPQSAPKPPAPKPSLVTAPSGGGVEHVPSGAVAALDAVFPG